MAVVDAGLGVGQRSAAGAFSLGFRHVRAREQLHAGYGTASSILKSCNFGMLGRFLLSARLEIDSQAPRVFVHAFALGYRTCIVSVQAGIDVDGRWSIVDVR